MTEDIENKIHNVAQREAIVDAVRKEVEGVHEISARSKSDLQYVEAHRSDVAALRETVDEVARVRRRDREPAWRRSSRARSWSTRCSSRPT